MKFVALTILAVLAIGTTAFVVPEKPHPFVAKVGHGAFCRPCEDIIKGGEEVGDVDLDHWLDVNFTIVCDSVLLIIHHECEEELKKVKKQLKKDIEDGVPPKKACKDLDFC
ncbi:unnamed protein product [Caenorhabditis auriculariae]|uniref:Saposin B-type domain-containing protein n=1 Tax=Caenorhabditis auriculariae TaxID=2777116 RepID=A0A8S1HCD2_9PELO|nr:unnamed protein product [Caenorhabditis auriculariae]